MANSLLPADYPHFLTALKAQIRATQVRAALAVTTELVSLYWHVGQRILGQE